MNILLLGPQARNANIAAFLESCGNAVWITEEPLTSVYVTKRGIDIIISNGYAPILKSPITDDFAGRIINVHPSYLPYGRGIAGNFWSFLKGSPKGISLHFIDNGIDSGDIIERRQVPMNEHETLRSSFGILMEAVEALFIEKWEDIAAQRYTPISQSSLDDPGTYQNRRQTEKLLDFLPDLWDTPVCQVEEMGADLFSGADFWDAWDEDIVSDI